jgi:truncated hemoglobin YjbI
MSEPVGIFGRFNGDDSTGGQHMSLYDDLGGTAAISAALVQFYPKILADPRTSPSFESVNIEELI